MHSHHSHSGDYVAHGVDPLDDMILQVEKMKFHTYCLTEHIPRIESKYLYPEEIESFENDTDALKQLEMNFTKFLTHAQRIKDSHKNKYPNIIIGTEIEACNTTHIQYAKQKILEYQDQVKFCVGSVHHINGIPIDFDQDNWYKALLSFPNKNLKKMLISYFESQYEMLQILQPKVVGHFDLFKLFWPDSLRVNIDTGECTESSSENDIIVTPMAYLNIWDDIKQLVIRNLKYINSYGGAIEINTSALRKGLKEPYPSSNIGELVKQYCQGRFVLSDDAHGIAQVGVRYLDALQYITQTLQLDTMYYLIENNENGTVHFEKIPITEFANNEFWTLLRANK
ncbi:similar to Saccharomyces cerevisiae YFR025C HIS2 Histidinolphosphatase, catalyzes the eighth step in histidine biosynthesis [Maudiozyma saulgeensis]|uniref:Histidinol-phosphatase n=1 Tax=Maudiozyma saulgeensis TaxID=1789683 RepID=A0A1X7R0Z8_9SACH|nr:similar to Saccharomyces cerevisiae YFR025C HIS2 Histidinolphosphatase, catalyzes the eighth step in histidine biosynthesis [Kazachstania saulgeensis]